MADLARAGSLMIRSFIAASGARLCRPRDRPAGGAMERKMEGTALG